MPNPQNTVQVAAHRAGERYLDTYELDLDAIPPARRFVSRWQPEIRARES